MSPFGRFTFLQRVDRTGAHRSTCGGRHGVTDARVTRQLLWWQIGAGRQETSQRFGQQVWSHFNFAAGCQECFCFFSTACGSQGHIFAMGKKQMLSKLAKSVSPRQVQKKQDEGPHLNNFAKSVHSHKLKQANLSTKMLSSNDSES